MREGGGREEEREGGACSLVFPHGEVVKACSLMAAITSLKRILEVRVWPW